MGDVSMGYLQKIMIGWGGTSKSTGLRVSQYVSGWDFHQESIFKRYYALKFWYLL